MIFQTVFYLNRNVKTKIPELFSFLAMVVLFFTLVTCRDYETLTDNESINKTLHDDPSLKGGICRNKNFILSVAAMFLFSIFFGKFWRKYKEKKVKKAEFLKKRAEQAEDKKNI